MTDWTPFQPVPHASAIAACLKQIPSHWSLTPLWEKRPYREGWQQEPFIPHQEIARLLQEGEQRVSKRTGQPYHAFCSGYGLRLGDPSEGLLAVDIDGSSADRLLKALAQESLPETVTWTSGKPGRRQLLYQIPQAYRERLQSFRRKTLTEWETVTTCAGELLEFRYNQHQSVLPPSFHRQTGEYRWLLSPEDQEIAIAPTWLCEFLDPTYSPQGKTKSPASGSGIRSIYTGVTGNSQLSQIIDKATSRLSLEEIYHWSGHQFQEIGETWRGYCPRHQSQSGTAFTVNRHTGEWYCFGCEVGGGALQYRHFLQGGNGLPRGKTVQTLATELATEAGLDPHLATPHQTYEATEIINQPYFNWETPSEGTLMAVKSRLGSGKTTWLAQVVAELRDEGWLALGHRNSLLLQSSQRWGFVHLQTEQAFDLINVPNSQLALCVDSLHHFSPEAFAGKNIILDEAIAVVTHLLTGDTLKQKRDKILQRFGEALQQAKRIFCLDGMLTDWCVDYLYQLAGRDRPLIKVENCYQGTPLQVKFLQDTYDEKGNKKRSDRSALLQQLWLSSKPVICTDSQLEAEALDQLLADTGKQGIRIDSKTISEPEIQTFLKSPNQYITTHCPDYLIYTPAAEAGIDISLKNYFSDQFCLFFGVLQTNAQLQMMSRLRDVDVTRWLWCSHYGQLNKQTVQFQFPEPLLEAIQSLILKTGNTLLAGDDTTAVVEEFIKEVTDATQDNHHQTFCILRAIHNHQQSYLWESLYQILLQEGHEVELVTLDRSSDAKQQEKEAKEAIKLKNAETIYQGKTQQGKLEQELLKKQLPNIEKSSIWTPHFIKKVFYDDRDFITKQERLWLIYHPEIAQEMMQSFWYSGIEPNLSSKVYQQLSLIQGLISLNLPPLLASEKCWTNHSPELQQLQHKIQETTLASTVKVTAKQATPIQVFRHVLRLVGVKLTRQNGGYYILGKQWQEPERLAVLACLDRRFSLFKKDYPAVSTKWR
ncbi:hypothetical protein FRE64_04835 [Euhalothece natronophila Z-M001]|uniref:Zinc finger CHC2-type domain-containing protein n=1 Tax=Euhalothece natronophila Z-M001 TaxID=522448 RepID=A0A5B8NJ75_9CHRO|nr:plasmid replication protein, CyRepA1 family [Euhalothece natronophila]QDZ39312.1 hypothetical protein FRE64_04835 [Euhalothece natronophila Z-M001]